MNTTPRRVPQLRSTDWSGHFGQNGQKLHEICKVNILGAKQWKGT